MLQKFIKLGYFSLPERTPKNFPKTFLFLGKDKKILIGKASGLEAPYHQFARSLVRGDITLTKEGEKFIKEAIKKGDM